MRTTYVVLALLCLCVSVPHPLSAQRGLFWYGGFELGGNLSPYSFKQNKSVLDYGIELDDDDKNGQRDDDDGHRSGKHNSINTSLYFRFSRRLGIEAGIAKNFIDFPLRDSRFQSASKDYNHGNFDPSASYTSKYLALHYYTKDRYGLGAQFFFGGGIALNQVNLTGGTEKHAEFDQVSNQNLSMNGHFTQNFYSPFIETGLFFYSPHKKIRSSFAVKYSFAPTLFSADYQSTQGGNVLYQDHVTANGSSLSVSYKCGFALYKPKEQLPVRSFSSAHHRKIKPARIVAKRKPEKDVLKARLQGCFGYDLSTKASFWLYENKNRYFLEKRDSNLHRAFVRELNFKSDESGLGKHDWVFVQNIEVKDKITLFTKSGNAESTYIKITAHQFLLNGKENRSLNVFQVKGGANSRVKIVWSPDSSKVSVVVFQPKSKQNNVYRLLIKTFDRNLNLLSSGNGDLPGIDNSTFDDFFLNEVCLSNHGETFLTGYFYKKKSLDRDFRIWTFSPENKRVSEIKLELKNISALLFKPNQNATNVVGFHNDPSRGADIYNTLFYGKINTDQMRLESIKVSSIKDAIEPSGKPNRLQLKDVSIINHKSGAIVVTEDWVHPSQLITIDNEGNVKNTSSSNYFSFLFSDLTWFNETNNSLQLISIANTRNLISDQSELLASKSKKKIVPVLVTIDSLGNRTRKLLLPSDSSKTVWRPYLSFKTDDNKILIAGKESGKYRFAKSKILKQQDPVLNFNHVK